MKRTQIYLNKKIIRLLDRLAKKTGKTRSELIRDAIEEVYSHNDVNKVIQKIVGLQSFADFEFSEKIKEYRKERQW